MKNIAVVMAAMGIAIVCVVAGVLTLMRQGTEEKASLNAKAPPPQEPLGTAGEVPPALVVEETLLAMPESPAPPSADLASAVEPAAATANAPSTKPPRVARRRPAREPLKDPLARDALALVGVDPCAEEYWYAAINDPELSAHERQDLIEDLNEDGLSDPKHPSLEDLPVILNRLQIIEVAGPYAMDQVNSDAFQEAYKDLVNLAELVLGTGEPVR